MSNAIIIGCPHDWTNEQVLMLAERLCADALPESVGVHVADADQIDVPMWGTTTVQVGKS